MVNCKLNKLILVNCCMLWDVRLQLKYAVWTPIKKRNKSQLYYDGLLLSNMCYYCYKHCYKATLTRSGSCDVHWCCDGCIGVVMGALVIDEANRKSVMESRLNHATMQFLHSSKLEFRWNYSTYFFSFAGRKASRSISWALRPKICVGFFLSYFFFSKEKVSIYFLFCTSGRKAWSAYWSSP